MKNVRTQRSTVERAEPDSEHHCSPVLRRSGAQRHPPPPLGLSKAHIPARQRRGSVTCYRGASLIQVRLRGDVAAGNTSGCGPRGEIVEFTPASRRRMLELLAKVEQSAVPIFVTLTYGALERLEPDEGKLSCPVPRGGSGGNVTPLPDKTTGMRRAGGQLPHTLRVAGAAGVIHARLTGGPEP